MGQDSDRPYRTILEYEMIIIAVKIDSWGYKRLWEPLDQSWIVACRSPPHAWLPLFENWSWSLDLELFKANLFLGQSVSHISGYSHLTHLHIAILWSYGIISPVPWIYMHVFFFISKMNYIIGLESRTSQSDTG